MRLGAGLAVLGVCVVGLGWWGRAEYATHMQAVLTEAAQEAVAGSVHGAAVSVEGRDIRVSGLADGPGEHDRLIAALDAIRGRRLVQDDLEILPQIQPFALRASWIDGAMPVTEGHAPTRLAQEALAALGAGELPLGAGAPDAAWGDAAVRGMQALRMLEEGSMALVDRRMSMAGLARTPVEGEAARAVLDQLPEGYQAELGLSYLDDGAPANYALHYTATGGAWVDGKLPLGVMPADLAGALGLAEIDDNASRALMGEPGGIPEALGRLRGWMDQVETLDAAVTGEGVAVEAGVGAGSNIALLGAALAEDLGDGVTLTVAEAASDATEGARRVHPVTGRDEVFSRGAWVPAFDFVPSAETCPVQTDAILADYRIGFLTGSAELDARARRSVNALAAVLRPCLTDARLRAEIGGHTDSTGSDATNLALSLARARTVREALIMRGLPVAALTAAGYGASQPIADNATEEGRQANRRTAVRWID